MKCPNCRRETEHRHLHDEAHGVTGTHMDGSERYECAECGYAMFPEEGERQGLRFFLDRAGGPA